MNGWDEVREEGRGWPLAPAARSLGPLGRVKKGKARLLQPSRFIVCIWGRRHEHLPPHLLLPEFLLWLCGVAPPLEKHGRGPFDHGATCHLPPADPA